MTDSEDPPRLSEWSAAPPELRALLRAARDDSATESELAQLASKLGPVLEPGPVSPLSPSKSLLTKLGVGAALVLVGAGGLFVAHAERHNNAQRPSPPSAAPAAPSSGPAPLVAQPQLEVGAPTLDTEPSKAPASSTATTPSGHPSALGARDTAAIPDEATLLERARSELSSNPAHALALTAEHAKDFPRGILAQEREVIAIAALRRLGRSAEAEKRAERFDRNYPNSAHQHAVDAVPAK